MTNKYLEKIAINRLVKETIKKLGNSVSKLNLTDSSLKRLDWHSIDSTTGNFRPKVDMNSYLKGKVKLHSVDTIKNSKGQGIGISIGDSLTSPSGNHRNLKSTIKNRLDSKIHKDNEPGVRSVHRTTAENFGGGMYTRQGRIEALARKNAKKK